jgi:hypothetical protein
MGRAKEQQEVEMGERRNILDEPAGYVAQKLPSVYCVPSAAPGESPVIHSR